MDIQYCFASPGEDSILTDEELKQPFIESPGKIRDELSLGAYFQGLHGFLLHDNPCDFLEVIQKTIPTCTYINDIKRLIFRSEKHGAFYHIASVEVFSGDKSVKLALSSALTGPGKSCLENDCRLLTHLLAGPGPHAVPEPYFFHTTSVTASGGKIEMAVALLEWFEGFHEWHLSEMSENGQRGICVWDMQAGSYHLSNSLGEQLIGKISEVLAQYYNPHTAQQIHPWHHAAGDFIVRIVDEEVTVKLITVRGYQPLASADERGSVSWVANMIRFFLHVSVWIRLDKLDGVGRTVWLDDVFVKPFIDGFFASYSRKFEQGSVSLAVNDYVHILKLFDHAELLAMCEPLLALYKDEAEADYKIISREMSAHLRILHLELQKLRS